MTTFEPGARLVFTQGLELQAALDGFFREQAGAEHQRWIRSVGAAGDGGDDDGAARRDRNESPLFFTLTCFGGAPAERLFEGRFCVA